MGRSREATKEDNHDTNGVEKKQEQEEINTTSSVVELEVPLGDAAETFNLTKAVCSHGLFMMSPNHWDPFSRTLSRPLRLLDNCDSDSSSSLWVSISQDPARLPHSILLRVFGSRCLSQQHKDSLVGQVVRMLRLSERDEKNAREFREIAASVGDGNGIKEFSGRVFRSPTLFEDMVKCILLCNCQWSRTLSMATALCELQLELQSQVSSEMIDQENKTDSSFIPDTPAGKESNRKRRYSKDSLNLIKTDQLEAEPHTCCAKSDGATQIRVENLSLDPSLNSKDGDSCYNCKVDSCLPTGLQSHEPMQHGRQRRVGNFPGPRELAKLDERFLAKRCNLGYRAGRIVKLAQGVVEGRIQLRELEEISDGASLSFYNKLTDQLREINGFGPFTCANVLMCMGFYHVVPTDSETIRHLKEIHAKNSTIQTVQRDVDNIYGKYAPFQFLAYWAELWQSYEIKFGNLSEMSCPDYKLITANNMQNKEACKSKRTKAS